MSSPFISSIVTPYHLYIQTNYNLLYKLQEINPFGLNTPLELLTIPVPDQFPPGGLAAVKLQTPDFDR